MELSPRTALALLLVVSWTSLVGCGNDSKTDASNLGPTSGGHGGASAGAAGSTALGGQGGQSSGGGAGGGGAAGGGGTTARPTGAVVLCAGDACPFGECADKLPDRFPSCRDGYPDAGAVALCKPAIDGTYCLVADKAWVITCHDGAASVQACRLGCGKEGTGGVCI